MKGCFCALLIFLSGYLSGQTTDAVTTNQDPPIYNDISGTPYVLTDWKEATIRFSSGRLATQFRIKFDCIKNQVMLQFEGNSFATQSKIREFVIYPKSRKEIDSMLFRKGFPVTDKANEETFYQVLLEGKTELLCLYLKQITEEQQIASKIIYRRIRDEKVFYLLKDQAMIQLPSDRATFSDVFYGHAEKIKQFVNEKQLKLRDAEDYKKVVEYYNSLL